MKKIILFAACALVLGIGCAKDRLAEKKPVIDARPVADISTTTASNPTTDTPVAKAPSATTNKKPLLIPQNNTAAETLAETLCRDKQSLGLAGYDGGEILKCGEYVKVIPPNTLEDAPDVMFTSAGKVTARCGGMPGPEPQELPAICAISCTKTGLFICSK